MLKVETKIKIKEDIDFILNAENLTILDLSNYIEVSRTTMAKILNGEVTDDSVYEKFYSYVYFKNYRLNKVREEILKEKYSLVLFHGSKNGLEEISTTGSRSFCDFGNGFYLSEGYSQALSFIYELKNSRIYSFNLPLEGLKIKKYEVNLEWMLSICYFRGYLKGYENTPLVKKIVKEVEGVDLIIAPIADNKMFYIMKQFSEGEINVDVAIHSLSASTLGKQYVIKSESALSKLTLLEEYYPCLKEKESCELMFKERSLEMDSKLKLAKREFKDGLYIEELFK